MFGNKRFSIKHKENFAGGQLLIVVDMITGVNYICTVGLGATSFSPLLDSEGKVIVDKEPSI